MVRKGERLDRTRKIGKEKQKLRSLEGRVKASVPKGDYPGDDVYCGFYEIGCPIYNGKAKPKGCNGYVKRTKVRRNAYSKSRCIYKISIEENSD